QVELAGVLPQHDRVLLAGEKYPLRAPLDLAPDEAPLLPRPPLPPFSGDTIRNIPYGVPGFDLRDFRFRARLFGPGVGYAKTLAGGETILVLEDPALGEAGERDVLQREGGLLEGRAGDVE